MSPRKRATAAVLVLTPGIHFRNADEASVVIARQIAKYRAKHYFGSADEHDDDDDD